MARTKQANRSGQPDNLTFTRVRIRRRGGALSKQERQEAQDRFIAVYSQGQSITKACEAANISRETLYTWKEHDEPFSLRFNLAKEAGNDVVRDEIRRRAVEGVDEPLTCAKGLVYDANGEIVTVKKYSDRMLEILAKARMPDEYRDRQQVQVSGQLDITTIAAEADAKFYSYLNAVTGAKLLGEPERAAENGASV